jgi:hypothetical protein
MSKRRLGKNILSNCAMNFKEATDILTRRITADEIAEAADVSISSIARARLDPSSSAYRSPPENWQPVLARLARERIEELSRFADSLDRG